MALPFECTAWNRLLLQMPPKPECRRVPVTALCRETTGRGPGGCAECRAHRGAPPGQSHHGTPLLKSTRRVGVSGSVCTVRRGLTPRRGQPDGTKRPGLVLCVPGLERADQCRALLSPAGPGRPPAPTEAGAGARKQAECGAPVLTCASSRVTSDKGLASPETGFLH